MSTKRLATVLASISAVAMVADAFAASAQDYQTPPPGYNQGYQQGYQGQPQPDQGYQQGYDQGPPPGYNNAAPPQGQYAPPRQGRTRGPATTGTSNTIATMPVAIRPGRRRTVSTGATTTPSPAPIIGGVLGAVIGLECRRPRRARRGHGDWRRSWRRGRRRHRQQRHRHSRMPAGLRGPPRGARRSTMPVPPTGSAYWGPSWYQPWVWADGRWVYHPYREWYYRHPTYWGGRRYHHY